MSGRYARSSLKENTVLKPSETVMFGEKKNLQGSGDDAVARDYFRHAIRKQRTRRRRVLPVLLVLSAMTLFAAQAFAQTDYDGAWNVTVVTKTGSC